MKAKKLIIIGNGFDLYFGLPTSYEEFEKHITKKHPKEKEDIEDVFLPQEQGESTLWSNFEENLERIDRDWFLANSPKTPDEAQELYPYIASCTDTIKELFERWAKALPCKVNSGNKTLIEDAFVISFNYTLTLEKNFNVGQNQIYHIHGTTKEDIVFGHKQGVQFPQRKIAPYDMDQEDLDQYNPNDDVVVGWLNDYLKKTEKPIDDIIPNSEKILANQYQFNFADIEEIFVIGHSYSEIDFPYFEWINRKTNAKWRLGYYKSPCKACHFFEKIQAKEIVLKPNKELIDEVLR